MVAEYQGRIVGHALACPAVPDLATRDAAAMVVCATLPEARGLGVGKLLVEECIRFARGAGYRKITLWTQSILVAARAIYLRAGFNKVREEPHTSFGKKLVGEYWELKL